MNRRKTILFLMLIFLTSRERAWPEDLKVEWSLLRKGLEYAAVPVSAGETHDAGTLHMVRIDPAAVKLGLFLASDGGAQKRAGEWCKEKKLSVAINAGMYQEDLRTNVGYLRHDEALNNPKWNPKYKTALGIGPRKKGVPAALMLDLDWPAAKEKFADYASVVQNLRLLKADAENVWTKQPKRWSEAAVGMDKEGRILFLFLRTPLTMWDFNELLRKLPIGIVRAMHVEGGPEASLSIHAGAVQLDLAGYYETGFSENNNSSPQWRIPNVIGVLEEK